MALIYYPFDAGAGAIVTEAAWKALSRLWSPDGVVIEGVDDLDFQVYADSSGRQVKVRPGVAVVQGFYAEDTVEAILAISANATGGVRVDRVVLRVDTTANTVTRAILEGTPGVVAPTRAGNIYEFVLGDVSVPNGAVNIAAGDVTDQRNNPNLGGMIHPYGPRVYCRSNARPNNPPEGLQIYEVDTNRVYTNIGTNAAPVWRLSEPVETIYEFQPTATAPTGTTGSDGVTDFAIPGIPAGFTIRSVFVVVNGLIKDRYIHYSFGGAVPANIVRFVAPYIPRAGDRIVISYVGS